MKKIKSIIINIFLTIALFQTVTAQKRDIVRADSEYDKYAYFDAIEIYKKVVDKGYESPDLFKKIGNSYYFNAELKEANIWYEKLFSIAKKEEIEPEYYYRYSHTLKSIENYTLSNFFLDEFSNLTKNDNRAKLFLSKKDYLVEIKELSGRQNITDAGINSEYSDYGSDEKVVDAVLNVIYKVNPNVDLERKRMSLNRALVELIENLESYLSRDKSRCIDAIRCVKDYLIDNLQMFK